MQSEMPIITDDEFYAIGRELDNKHAIFYRFWEMGKPTFSTAIPTACIAWDRDFSRPSFIMNPDFWTSLNQYNRVFVIAHEMLHIILNHGIRLKDFPSQELGNLAIDIVVNHLLVNKFGFFRSKITDQEKLCWVDTIFRGKKVVDDKHMEYYLKMLMDEAKKIQAQGGEGQAGNGAKTVDVHGGMPSTEEMEGVLKNINDSLSPSEKEDLKEVIQKHYQNEGQEGYGEGFDPCSGRGLTGTGVWTFMPIEQVPKKRKWETIIIKWAMTRIVPSDKSMERWERQHRRLVCVSTDTLRLPCEMDVDSFSREEKRITVKFFLDTSGSCIDLAPRFWKAAHSLSSDKFDVELYWFNTAAGKVDPEKNKLPLGGGTTLQCIESLIQQEMKDQGTQYPDAVFVLSDGDGGLLKAEHPEKHYWFLTNKHYACNLLDCNTYDLRDFE